MKIKLHFIYILLFLPIYGQVHAQAIDTLIGTFDRTAFEQEPYSSWYNQEYQSYEVMEKQLDQLSFGENIHVDIVLGTWCSDSRREVPRFLKILDQKSIGADSYTLIGLNRKKMAPGFDAVKWEIDFVPTFIFLEDGKEIGRIIETPELSMEEDMIRILK